MGYETWKFLSHLFLIAGIGFCALSCFLYRWNRIRKILDDMSGYTRKQELKHMRLRSMGGSFLIIVTVLTLQHPALVYGAVMSSGSEDSISSNAEDMSEPIPDIPFQLSGTKDDDSEWYRDSIHIIPAEGYAICYADAAQEQQWEDELIWSEEGVSRTEICLKNLQTERVTEPIPVEGLQLDTGNPTDLQIDYSESVLNKLRTVFGYYRDYVTVTVSARDSTSGVSGFSCSYQDAESGERHHFVVGDSDENFTTDLNGMARYSFRIPAQFSGQVSFEAMDAAGNSAAYYDGQMIIVDNTNPKMNIRYEADENSALQDMITLDECEEDAADSPMRYLYNGSVIVTMDVKEAYFRESDPEIRIMKDGKDVTDQFSLQWNTENDRHVLCLSLKQDGDYQLKVSYADASGNPMEYQSFINNRENQEQQTVKTGRYEYTSDIITIDQTKPDIRVEYPSEEAVFHEDVSVNITVREHDFDPSKVEWSITSKDLSGSKESVWLSDVAGENAWMQNPVDPDVWIMTLIFSKDGIFDWSLKVTDLADNRSDLYQSGSFTVDQTGPEQEGMSISYSEPLHVWQEILNGITFGMYSYQQKLTMEVSAEDMISGIDMIHWIYQTDAADSTDGSLSFQEGFLDKEDLILSGNGSLATAMISLDAGGGNQYRGHFAFQVRDVAGNMSGWKSEEDRINIVDTLAPDIEVQFPEPIQEVDGVSYYNGAISVFLRLTENNFYPDDVSLTLDGEAVNCDWKKAGNVYQAYLKIAEEGRHTLMIQYIDRSENYMATYETTPFIIDSTKPQITVEYNHADNQLDDGMYYGSDLIGTIYLHEEWFRAEDFKVTAVDESEQTTPLNVIWETSDSGTWKGQFSLGQEGAYRIQITGMDPARNELEKYSSERFVIDQTAPVIYMSGIENSSANNQKQCSFMITARDENGNLDSSSYQVDLNVLTRDANGRYQRGKIICGNTRVIQNRTEYQTSISNLEQDGLYELTASVSDYAGNESKDMEDASAECYEKIVFSVNRDGSVFFLDSNTQNLNEQYYVRHVTNDLVIDEVNPDTIEACSLSLNHRLLQKDVDYTIEEKDSDQTWKRYRYQINKELFAEEGEYSLVLFTTDKAGNDAYSDVKDAAVQFVVDRSSPEVTIVGLEDGGTYQALQQEVVMMPEDIGGKLRYLKVYVRQKDGSPLLDEYGNDISERLNLDNENNNELDELLAEQNGQITVSIPEGYHYKVQILCDDYVGISGQKSNLKTIEYHDISVSPSKWMLFWSDGSNKFRVILGLAIMTVSILLLYFGKNKGRFHKKTA